MARWATSQCELAHGDVLQTHLQLAHPHGVRRAGGVEDRLSRYLGAEAKTTSGLGPEARRDWRGSAMSYHMLERIGRIPLSRHFSLRQFLYSEIAAAHNIPNVPDDIELAVVTGTRLCQDILEPIVDLFGPIIIRSGYRSTRLNAFGCEHRLRCASNKRNRAYHIWDQRDHNGHTGAAACIVIPEAAERYRPDQIDELASVLHRHLPITA